MQGKKGGLPLSTHYWACRYPSDKVNRPAHHLPEMQRAMQEDNVVAAVRDLSARHVGKACGWQPSKLVLRCVHSACCCFLQYTTHNSHCRPGVSDSRWLAGRYTGGTSGSQIPMQPYKLGAPSFGQWLTPHVVVQ